MASDKTPEFEICNLMQVCTHVSHNPIALHHPFLFPLSTLRVVKALGWMFEEREDLKNERDYKQTNMPLAAIPDWTLFSCQCFVFNVYTVSRDSYPSP